MIIKNRQRAVAVEERERTIAKFSASYNFSYNSSRCTLAPGNSRGTSYSLKEKKK